MVFVAEAANLSPLRPSGVREIELPVALAPTAIISGCGGYFVKDNGEMKKAIAEVRLKSNLATITRLGMPIPPLRIGS